MVSDADYERTTEATHAAGDAVEIRTYDVARLRDEIPMYDDLTAAEKLWAIRLLDDDGLISPEQRASTGNTTCVGLSERLVKAADPADTQGAMIPERLALGGGSPTPAYSDTSLAKRFDVVDVTRYRNEGETIACECFVPSKAGNELGITEAGLLFKGTLLNHAAFNSAIDKNDSETATITGKISWTNASQ